MEIIKELEFTNGQKGWFGYYKWDGGVFVVPCLPNQSKKFVEHRIKLCKKGIFNAVKIF